MIFIYKLVLISIFAFEQAYADMYDLGYTYLTGTPDSDYSTYLLSILFGYVSDGSLDKGASLSLFSIFVSNFNSAVFMIVSAFGCTYHILVAVVSTSNDGQPLSQKVSGFTALRMAGGLGLLYQRSFCHNRLFSLSAFNNESYFVWRWSSKYIDHRSN